MQQVGLATDVAGDTYDWADALVRHVSIAATTAVEPRARSNIVNRGLQSACGGWQKLPAI